MAPPWLKTFLDIWKIIVGPLLKWFAIMLIAFMGFELVHFILSFLFSMIKPL